MGHFKELFIDYNSMTKEEIAVHQASLATNQGGSGVGSTPPTKQTLVYRKSFTARERELWRVGRQDNPFLSYQKAHTYVMRYQLAYDLTVDSHSYALRLLQKVNLLRFLGVEVRRGSDFYCPIIPGNIASINCDEYGDWRYFTRNSENTDGYVFGIVDLTQLMYDLSYYEALNKLYSMLLINFSEDSWVYQQRVIYTQNIDDIDRAAETFAVRYPQLYKFVKRHLYVLRELNGIGYANVASESEAVEEQSVFFASTRYLAEKLRSHGIKKDHASIERVVNMFAALGLLHKVHADQLPSHLEMKAREQLNTQRYKFIVGFYCIPTMTDKVLEEANRRVIQLNSAGIKATGITVDNLGKVLGAEVVDRVYGDKDRRNLIQAIRSIKRRKWLELQSEDNDQIEITDSDLPF